MHGAHISHCGARRPFQLKRVWLTDGTGQTGSGLTTAQPISQHLDAPGKGHATVLCTTVPVPVSVAKKRGVTRGSSP